MPPGQVVSTGAPFVCNWTITSLGEPGCAPGAHPNTTTHTPPRHPRPPTHGLSAPIAHLRIRSCVVRLDFSAFGQGTLAFQQIVSVTDVATGARLFSATGFVDAAALPPVFSSAPAGLALSFQYGLGGGNQVRRWRRWGAGHCCR